MKEEGEEGETDRDGWEERKEERRRGGGRKAGGQRT